MTRFFDKISTPRLTAAFATGLAVFSLLILATYSPSANAAGHHGGGHGGGGHRGGGGYRGGGGWTGGYYPAPPVIYGDPYGVYPYGYPPPVVYGPSIGIAVPGISIGIR